MNIYGKRVMLRAVTEADLDMMLEMINDPDIERQAGGWSFPLSPEQQALWFKDNMNGDRKHFVIVDEDGRPVGTFMIYDLDWKNRNALIGCKIAKLQRRGQGLGRDACMAALRYCFDELGLHRVTSSYFDTNYLSKKGHAKCGFTVEGCLREAFFQEGTWKDMVFVGILEKEYRALIEETHYWDRDA